LGLSKIWTSGPDLAMSKEQFLFEFVPRMALPAIAVFGLIAWIWPGVPRLLRTKLRRGLGAVNTVRTWTYSIIIGLVAVVAAGLIALYAVDEWRKIVKSNEDPLVTEANTLANAIEFDVKNGIEATQIYRRYENQLAAIMPRLLGAGSTPELGALSVCYGKMEIGPQQFTNLAAKIRAGAGSLKESKR